VSDENRLKSQAREPRFVFKKCRQEKRSVAPLDWSFDRVKNNGREEVMNRKRKRRGSTKKKLYNFRGFSTLALLRYKRLPVTGITYDGCPESIGPL
jgi:hypothetical protein